jgi:hypothetical protein
VARAGPARRDRCEPNHPATSCICYGFELWNRAATPPRASSFRARPEVPPGAAAIAVKGWQGAFGSRWSRTSRSLARRGTRSFDVLVGCDFSKDGSADDSTLRARAIAADPANPAVMLARKGGEYTAVQSIKSGAFDYIPKKVAGRSRSSARFGAQCCKAASPTTMQRARRAASLRLRQCATFATHDNVSARVQRRA